MVCKKCNGKVMIDRVFSEKQHLELACIICGTRWMLDKEKDRFASWLISHEEKLAKVSAVSI